MAANVDASDDDRIRARIIAAIRELLDLTGMTQAQLSRELGREPASICRALSAKRELKASEIGQLAVLFRVPAGFFFGDDVEVEWLDELRAAKQRAAARDAKKE